MQSIYYGPTFYPYPVCNPFPQPFIQNNSISFPFQFQSQPAMPISDILLRSSSPEYHQENMQAKMINHETKQIINDSAKTKDSKPPAKIQEQRVTQRAKNRKDYKEKEDCDVKSFSEENNPGRWSQQEHTRFIEGMDILYYLSFK